MIKKYIAPLVSALIAGLVIIAFGLFYFFIFREIPGVGYVGYIFMGIALIAVTITAVVLIQRFMEIQRGEDDDLGKY
jgi:hypothetical protein